MVVTYSMSVNNIVSLQHQCFKKPSTIYATNPHLITSIFLAATHYFIRPLHLTFTHKCATFPILTAQIFLYTTPPQFFQSCSMSALLHSTSLLLSCLICCLSMPTMKLIYRVLASQVTPSVFNKSLALALATSGLH